MTKKQKRLLYRIIISLLLFVICIFIPEKYALIRALAFLAPYIAVGYDVIKKAVKNIFSGQIFDENFLMLAATVGAYALGEYSEAVMVLILYQIGELFQSCAVSKTRKSITALMDIRPDSANKVYEDGSINVISPEELAPGDIILIKSGEKIPVDCVVTKGESYIDTTALTGEAQPVAVKEDSILTSGCVNISGTLYARVNKPFSESTVSKILELTEKSAEKKSKSENFITKFAKYYTPAVCALAVFIVLVPTALYGDFASHVKSGLIFLVVSCPCALVISVPLSFFCGMGGASKNGILIKGAVYIEALSKLKTVIFDKTGTLTKGKFEISEVKSANGFDNEQLLYLAAAAEKYSDHPIALAIKEKADISDSITEKAEQIVGKGVRALVDNKKVCVGNKAFMKDENVDFEDDFSDGTHVYVSADGVYAGVIIVKDMIKDGAKEALQTLRNYGAEAVMLTGDKKSVGEKTAKALGIEKAYCELLPSDKVEIAEKIIAENKGKNKVTAFAGDGINDAPVLSVSDVGIAMGVVGSDAAIEAANVVLMDDNLSKIPLAMKISSKTMRIVKQNVVFTLTVKIAVMILSVMGYANMWLAIFADVGAAVIAILNAVRAFGIKKTD